MKIVVLDGYTENPGDLSWGELEKLGDLTVYDRTPVNDEDEIIRRIGDAELVYTNKTPISKRVIDACPSMKFISLLEKKDEQINRLLDIIEGFRKDK